MAATLFEQADWTALADLPLGDCKNESERARAAVYIACAHHRLGDHEKARHFIKQAQEWGCPLTFMARLLVAALHETLGHAAVAAKDEERAAAHFKSALAGAGAADDSFALHDRALRALAHLGLLSDAANKINLELWRLRKRHTPPDQEAKMKILRTELALLNEELATAVKRRQLTTSVQEKQEGLPQGYSRARLKRHSVAQLEQDLWALEVCGFKKGGYFVEFGATNGVALSNTYLLEAEFGWTGLLAEPNPKFLEALRKNRKATTSSACISSVTGEEAEFIFADVFGGMTDFADDDKHGERRKAYRDAGHVARLKTISLHDFLEQNGAPRDIDYISVDTEGSEYEILKSFPFEKWNVRCWTIEHNFAPFRDDLYNLMTKHGYQRVEAQWDDWYYR